MTTRDRHQSRRRANAGPSVWRAGGTAVYGARDIPPELSGVGREVISILLKTPAKPWLLARLSGCKTSEIDAALIQLTPIVSNLCESDDGRLALANPRNDGIIGSGAVWAPGKHGPSRQLALTLAAAALMLLAGCNRGVRSPSRLFDVATGTPEAPRHSAFIPVVVGWPRPMDKRTPTPTATRTPTDRETLLAAVSGVARVRGVDGAGLSGASCVVSSLDFQGPGTLRECLSAQGRWITFSVSGRIIAPQDLSVPSNTTIDARGSGVQLWGGGLILRRVEDVIIAGLSITEGDGDAIRVHNRSAGIWLGWLDLSHCDDGLLDVTGASTDVTLAHSVLHDHAKGMLFGASPNDSGDSVMRVTVHDTIIATTYRHPKCRYGWVHLDRVTFGPWQGEAVDASYNCRVLITRSAFVPGGPGKTAVSLTVSEPRAPGAARIVDTDLAGALAETGGEVENPRYTIRP